MYPIIKSLSLFTLLLFFTACEDKALVKIKPKLISQTDLSCMKLLIFPPNQDLQKAFEGLYDFKQECSAQLFISYKSNIVCNSNQNASHKAKGMPSGYLRLELKEGKNLLYSYYIDLDDGLGKKEVQRGFLRLQEDIF